MKSRRLLLWLIILITLAAFYIDLPGRFDLKISLPASRIGFKDIKVDREISRPDIGVHLGGGEHLFVKAGDFIRFDGHGGILFDDGFSGVLGVAAGGENTGEKRSGQKALQKNGNMSVFFQHHTKGTRQVTQRPTAKIFNKSV